MHIHSCLCKQATMMQSLSNDNKAPDWSSCTNWNLQGYFDYFIDLLIAIIYTKHVIQIFTPFTVTPKQPYGQILENQPSWCIQHAH